MMELFSTHPELPIVFEDGSYPQTFEELMQAWRQWALEDKFSLPLLTLTQALRENLDREGFVLEGEPLLGVAVQGGAKLLVHWSRSQLRHPDSKHVLTMCVDWTISTQSQARLYVELQSPEGEDFEQVVDVLGTEPFSLNLDVHAGVGETLAPAHWFERAQDCIGLCFASSSGVPNRLDQLRSLVVDELCSRASA